MSSRKRSRTPPRPDAETDGSSRVAKPSNICVTPKICCAQILFALGRCRDAPTRPGLHILWQCDRTGYIPTAFVAVITKRQNSPSEQVTWADHLNIGPKRMDKHNPTVLDAYFGHSIQRILTAVPDDVTELQLFKIPLSFTGKDIGLLYQYQTVEGLKEYFAGLPLNLTNYTQHPRLEFMRKTNKFMMQQYQFVQRYMTHQQPDHAAFATFLWNSRQTLNEVLTIANHHIGVSRVRKMLLPTHKFADITANIEVPTHVLGAVDLTLIRHAVGFWSTWTEIGE